MANTPKKQRAFWWLDWIMALLIVGTGGCILLIGGHGGGFLFMYFLDRPSDMLLSPWGQMFWAALLLILSSWLPGLLSKVTRWIAILLLVGFVAWLGLLPEDPKWTLVTAIPFFVACAFQLVRTIHFQRSN